MHTNLKTETALPGLFPNLSGRIRERLGPHMAEVMQGASVAFTLKVLGAGFAFGFNVLLARMLGAEGAGMYFLALTVATIACVLGRMGLDNALLRFTAAGTAIEDWSAVKGVYRKGMSIALCASAASALLLFALAPWLAHDVFSKPQLASPLRWMALAVVPMTLVSLHAETLKGLKRIRDSLLVQGVGIPALSLLGLYLMGRRWGIHGAVWAYVLAAAAMALVGIALWRVATPQLKGVSGRFETRELLRSSMPLFWVTSTMLMMNWTATIALGVWGTKADVGLFGVAYRTAMLTSFVLVAVNSIAAPKFAALYKQGDMESLGSMARNCAKLATALAAPALILFFLAPGWVMGLFGPQFLGGGAILAILAIGQFVNVATGSVGYLLIMSGNERLLRNSALVAGGTNLVLTAILIPRFGVVGAAVATAICLALQNLVASYLVYKKMDLVVVRWLIERRL